MSDYLDPNNEELVKDFLAEAYMQVEVLETNILSIENNPEDSDAVDEIFRAAHTLKGGAATVQLSVLSGFTHVIEDLLDEIRSHHISINGEIIDTLLSSIDIIKMMLKEKENGMEESEDDSVKEIKAKLLSFSKGEAPAPEADASAPQAGKAPAQGTGGLAGEDIGLSEYEILEMEEAAGEHPIYLVSVVFDESNPMNSVGGIQIFTRLKDFTQVLKTNPDFEKLYDDSFKEKTDYYVASDLSASDIKDKLFLSDVTKSIGIKQVTKTGIKPTEVEEAPVVEETKPAPQAEVKAEKAPEPEKKAEETIEEALQAKAETAEKQPKKTSLKETSSMGSVLRVDNKRIDALLNLVSEAVINKATFNQISNKFSENLNNLQNTEIQFKEKIKLLQTSILENMEETLSDASVRDMKDIKKQLKNDFTDLAAFFEKFEGDLKANVDKFKSTSSNLARNTSELHEAILRIRMVPINQIFSRFPRLVRDLSRMLNKKVSLQIEGEDTELDKSVIEQLLDPLMHCVRNSLDHGVEDPEERIAKGKSPEGQILLKASNEGNIILIEISDDGAGIDVDSIRLKAIDRGIIHPSKILTDIEAFNLIFDPGFSTAKKVTNISGRGVGLDVVKKQIEKLNGTVSVWSEPDKGTKFTIKLPLTLAIIQALLVRVGSEVYAIPITSVAESHRIKEDETSFIDNHEVFNLREDVISMIRLNKLFHIPADNNTEYKFVVIVGSGEKKVGLMVDQLINEEDVVIKPLKDKYTNSPGIAGATILGDGTVSLIIDVNQLIDLGIQKEKAMKY